MKKFFALVLALVMALSLTTIAWGATNYVSSGVNCETDTEVSGTQDFGGATITFVGTDAAREDVAVHVTGDAVIKNAVFEAAHRGIDATGAFTSLTIDNVTVVNSARAIHFESSSAADLNVSNSTFAGKISYVLRGGTATFTNCTFKANSSLVSAKGNMIEPWSETVFINCVFEEGFEVSLDDWKNPANPDKDLDKSVELTNCIYAGEPVTADNVDDLFTNEGTLVLEDVAPASYTATGTTAVDTKDAKTMAVKGAMVIEMVPAKDAYVATATGNWVPGYVKHYVDEYGTTYVPCTADVEGALYLYYKGTTSVYDTVVAANPFYDAVAAEFTSFGTACGQLDNRADTTAKYYTYADGNGVVYLNKGTTATAKQVMVNGKLVGVEAANLIGNLNAHKWVVEKNAKNEITKATCSLCGQQASWTLNLASVPTGATFVPAPGGGFLYWNAVPVADTETKVESAETFDAGIAMYVGMSVLAATGAVVLKKRED